MSNNHEKSPHHQKSVFHKILKDSERFLSTVLIRGYQVNWDEINEFLNYWWWDGVSVYCFKVYKLEQSYYLINCGRLTLFVKIDVRGRPFLNSSWDLKVMTCKKTLLTTREKHNRMVSRPLMWFKDLIFLFTILTLSHRSCFTATFTIVIDIYIFTVKSVEYEVHKFLYAF